LVVLCLFSGLVAATCIGLGLWQLDRHRERAEWVTRARSRFESPPLPLSRIPTTDSLADFTRVFAHGRYDLANEIVLTRRTRRGAPGVNVLTPLVLDDGSAVIVNRGWVYSPDGSTVRLELFRDSIRVGADSTLSDTLTISGFAVSLPGPQTSARTAAAPTAPRKVARLSRDSLSMLLPYGTAAHLIRLAPTDSNVRPGVPVPLPPPALDAGPHLSYAIQWFAFAIIAVVGCAAVVRTSRSVPAVSTGRTVLRSSPDS
jgi:surfeit locus 1 family protein